MGRDGTVPCDRDAGGCVPRAALGRAARARAGRSGRAAKTLLLGPTWPRAAGVPQIWRVGTEVAALSQDLPEDWRDLPQALLAALNDPTQAAALDRFKLWRDTEAVPLDTPWPSEPGSGTI